MTFNLFCFEIPKKNYFSLQTVVWKQLQCIPKSTLDYYLSLKDRQQNLIETFFHCSWARKCSPVWVNLILLKILQEICACSAEVCSHHIITQRTVTHSTTFLKTPLLAAVLTEHKRICNYQLARLLLVLNICEKKILPGCFQPKGKKQNKKPADRITSYSTGRDPRGLLRTDECQGLSDLGNECSTCAFSEESLIASMSFSIWWPCSSALRSTSSVLTSRCCSRITSDSEEGSIREYRL